MRRLRRIAPLAAVAIVLSGAFADAPAGARSASPRPVVRYPARLMVYAQEWSLWGSRPTVPAGQVIVQLWDRGQDAHNLRIRRIGRAAHLTGLAQGVQVTQSGAISQATWRLAPGRYELYCGLAGHMKMGMHTTLVVR